MDRLLYYPAGKKGLLDSTIMNHPENPPECDEENINKTISSSPKVGFEGIDEKKNDATDSALKNGDVYHHADNKTDSNVASDQHIVTFSRNINVPAGVDPPPDLDEESISYQGFKSIANKSVKFSDLDEEAIRFTFKDPKNLDNQRKSSVLAASKPNLKITSNCDTATHFLGKDSEVFKNLPNKRTFYKNEKKNNRKKSIYFISKDCIKPALDCNTKKSIIRKKERIWFMEKETTTDDLIPTEMLMKKCSKDVGTEMLDKVLENYLDGIKSMRHNVEMVEKEVQSTVESKSISTNVNRIFQTEPKHSFSGKNETCSVRSTVQNYEFNFAKLASVDQERRVDGKRCKNYNKIMMKAGQKFINNDRTGDTDKKLVTRKDRDKRKINYTRPNKINLSLTNFKNKLGFPKEKLTVDQINSNSQIKTLETQDVKSASHEAPKPAQQNLMSEFETKFVKGCFARHFLCGKNKISVKRRAISSLDNKHYAFMPTKQKKSSFGLKMAISGWERSKSHSILDFNLTIPSKKKPSYSSHLQ